jgi:hypothetical protein
MRKYPKELHSEYIPIKTTEYLKTTIVEGIIVGILFKKVKHLSLLLWIRTYILRWPEHKEVYFWLPYKTVIEDSEKYSNIGSNKRFPYAAIWFQIKPNCDIYKQGLTNYAFASYRIKNAEAKLRFARIFDTNELMILTRKSVIRMLDDFVFTKKHGRIK